jgi:hypothetical protein
VELYLHSPNTPSWHGAQLKHWDNFTFTFTFYLQHMYNGDSVRGSPLADKVEASVRLEALLLLVLLAGKQHKGLWQQNSLD